MMNSRTWETISDPCRKVAKTAFGMDYMKAYTSTPDVSKDVPNDRVLELQGLDGMRSSFQKKTGIGWLIGGWVG